MCNTKLSLQTCAVFICACSLLLSGCQEKTPFRGTLHTIDDISDVVQLKGDVVSVDSPHTPLFAVYDSVAVFYKFMQPYCYQVYDIKNNKPIGDFFPCGHGNGEFVNVSDVREFYEENGDVKALVYTGNEEKLVIWNVSRSIAEGKTVCESREYKSDTNYRGVSYNHCAFIGKDSVLVYLTSVYDMNENRVTPAMWQIRSYPDNKLIREIQLFDPVNNNKTAKDVLQENFLEGFSCIKSDRSKVVEGMYYLPQINITDLKTGKADGYLIGKRSQYDIFQTDMKDAKRYCNGIQADNDHIYVLCRSREKQAPSPKDALRVYDWKGHFVKKVKLSTPVERIFLDQKNGLLYGVQDDKNELIRYCVADIFK